ncbi:hypothetical protein ES703_114318 [subsurface metagenome]
MLDRHLELACKQTNRDEVKAGNRYYLNSINTDLGIDALIESAKGFTWNIRSLKLILKAWV